jgi:hypothetical protein
MHSWGSQKDLLEGFGDGSEGLFPGLIREIQCSLPGVGSPLCGFSRPGRESSITSVSSSVEVDVMSIQSESTHTHGERDSPSVSPAYEELVEVINRAVDKLNIVWKKNYLRVWALVKKKKVFRRVLSPFSHTISITRPSLFSWFI